MKPLTEAEANEVYDILSVAAGASDAMRPDFVFHQTHGVCTEYRFMGHFGFGGKFWRTIGFRPDESLGETMYVSYYPEDDTQLRRDTKSIINSMLWEVQYKREINA